MEIKKLQLGLFWVNCYIISFGSNCIIIDPGADEEEIKRYIAERKLEPLLVINTHGHYDHTGSVPAITEFYGISLYIHPLEQETIVNPDLNLSSVFGNAPFSVSSFKLIDKNTKPYLSELGLKIIHTPGHTPGSISIKSGNCLFCGDLLFKQTIGRTDFPGGDLMLVKESLRKIRKMDKNLLLYPGHNQETVLSNELASNYYLGDSFLGKDK